jgi:predicted O-methyltransferase YrrM
MWTDAERREIDRIWERKLAQDAAGLEAADRHRNLEPVSAQLLTALAIGAGARALLEVGGSSGLSTIALAAAARRTRGRLVSIEIEPERQREARETIEALGLATWVDFRCGDARQLLPELDPVQLALLDSEKEDYVPFFDLLQVAPGGLVVADNVLSHDLTDYIAHVRSIEGVESITLPVGKGLELSRLP